MLGKHDSLQIATESHPEREARTEVEEGTVSDLSLMWPKFSSNNPRQCRSENEEVGSLNKDPGG